VSEERVGEESEYLLHLYLYKLLTVWSKRLVV
jgi:hypothetical protein